jgi:voltage-gated sodium channel
MKHVASLIVEAPIFRGVVIAAILLAGVLAGLETSAALMDRFGQLFRLLDNVVLTIFVGEAALKIASHGARPWGYFKDGWNVFDFTIVVLCLLPASGPFATVLRLARTLRLLRLVSTLPKLQLLVGALLRSLSSMGYVSLLLGLLFYIYAVAGVHLFGSGDALNFGSIAAALFTLFRIVTLDNWSEIFALQLTQPMPIKAVAYFTSFVVFGTMIILNLFIGIIMNSMAEMHDEIAKTEDESQQNRRKDLDEEIRGLEAEAEKLAVKLRRLRKNPVPPIPRAVAGALTRA